MAEYYISNGGSDLNLGTSVGQAWQTLAKINTLLAGPGLNGGDVVFLERDSIWYEQLEIPTQNDGSSSNPILFTAYGTGSLPIISGHKHLTGWVSIGGNKYEIVDSGFPDYVQMLQINGVNRPKVWGPKRMITSNGTTTTLVSDNLPNYNYAGGEGEVVVETNPYIIDKCRIISRSGNTLTITATTYPTQQSRFYIVQNLEETLQENGDWMYSPSQKTITIYSNVNPNSLDVRVSYRQRCINAVGNQWNEFHDIELQGANDEAFRLDASRYAKLDGIHVRDTGLSGIGLWTAQDCEIRNCYLSNTYCTGIQQRNNSRNLIIEDSYIEGVYPFPGSGGSGNARGFSIFGSGDDTIIRRNTVINSGYVGISFGGNRNLVEYNFVDGFCITKHDGGGIYSYGGTKDQHTYVDRVVKNNIVIGSDSANSLDASVGYYTDDNQENVVYENNVAINTPDAGLYNHNSHEIEHYYNTVYSSRYGKLFTHNAINEQIRNNIFEDQTIVLLAKDETPYKLLTELGAADLAQYGDLDDNLFILCSQNEFVVATRYIESGKLVFNNLTLSQWRGLGYDINSEVRLLGIPECEIESLGDNKFQGDGTFQSGSIAFTGIFYQGGVAVREIDTSSKITGTNSLRARVTSESTQTTRVELTLSQLGALEEGEIYRCRFKALAPSGHQSLNIYLNEAAWPYTRLTRDWHFVATDAVTEFDFTVDKFKLTANCSMVIDFQSHQGDLYIDDFEFRELTSYVKTNYEDHVRVIFNKENTTEVFPIAGNWEDTDGNPVGSSVELAPFQSLVILKSQDPGPTAYYRGKRWLET